MDSSQTGLKPTDVTSRETAPGSQENPDQLLGNEGLSPSDSSTAETSPKAGTGMLKAILRDFPIHQIKTNPKNPRASDNPKSMK